jgi:chromosome segregation ATPase
LNSFTKVLAVLLTLVSIFLCGAVVTYVIDTSNVMDKNETLETNYDALKSKTNMQLRQADEGLVKAKNEIKSLNERVAALENEKTEIMIELKNAQHDVVKWQDRVNGWAGVIKSFEQTISEMEKTLIATRDQLSGEQVESVKLSNRLNEMTTALDEKIVMLEALEAEKRRYQEKNAMLEEKIAKLQEGKSISKTLAEPVTMAPSANASMAGTNYADAPIQGVVNDIQNDLVSISVGKADGVKPGMKFHVARGVNFICDITITDVDINKSVGVIGLSSNMPRIGDSASTEL